MLKAVTDHAPPCWLSCLSVPSVRRRTSETWTDRTRRSPRGRGRSCAQTNDGHTLKPWLKKTHRVFLSCCCTARLRITSTAPETVSDSLRRPPPPRSAEGGVRRLWAGLLPRGFRIVCATIILSKLREKVTDAFEKMGHAAAEAGEAGAAEL